MDLSRIPFRQKVAQPPESLRELAALMAPFEARDGPRFAIEGDAAAAWHDFIIRRYKPPASKRFLVCFPCSVGRSLRADRHVHRGRLRRRDGRRGAAGGSRVPLDEDCMAIATPKLGFAHAAMILRPAKTREMFSMRLRVKDLLLVPTPDDVWFSDRPLP